MILREGMVLYHGSYTEIDKIDLSLCVQGKDFGKGFYLTDSKSQAVSFIRNSLIKAKSHGRIPEDRSFGFVTEYVFKPDKNYSAFEFSGADEQWLYYIGSNRRSGTASVLRKLLIDDYDRYDIISGKIANDDTNATLEAFLSGLYGDIGSPESARVAIGLLKPERLSDQICFRTERSLAMLKKMGARRYDVR